jgi:hypothetical protein
MVRETGSSSESSRLDVCLEGDQEKKRAPKEGLFSLPLSLLSLSSYPINMIIRIMITMMSRQEEREKMKGSKRL